jgi:aryl-alcohol dehydrogenase-like predicted oxidoreductase
MKLALGTVQFGLDYGLTNNSGQVAIEEVRNILTFANNNNIDTLDTAFGYGNSEKVLGNIGINDFKIVTKTAPLKLGVDNVLQSFHKSLKDLKISSVDGLLVHNIDDIKDKKFDTLYKEINKLKKDQLISKIGFSTYTPDQVDFLLDNFDFDLIQVPFNLLDKRLINGGQLKALKNKKIETHARSIFLQGLLLMSTSQRPKYFNNWNTLFKKWDLWLKTNNISGLEAALNFALSENLIDKIVIGIDSKIQLREVFSASKSQILNIPKFLNSTDEMLINPSLWEI